MSSIDDLNWKLIETLTSPATPCDTIRYFTEHAGTELHPCITAEIVLKWWSVRKGVCPDNTFIKTLFTKVQDVYTGFITLSRILDIKIWYSTWLKKACSIPLLLLC